MAIPEVRVITAECGEPQLPVLSAGLRAQRGVAVEHVVISGLSAIEAEDAVYQAARHAKATAKWVVRLDADMTLRSPDSLRMMLANAERERVSGRMTLPVRDWFTAAQIIGVHVLRSSEIPYTRITREAQPDYWLMGISGRTHRFARNPQVDHASAPDVVQALRFGLHRGIKAKAGGVRAAHWRTLARLERRDMPSGRRALLAALFGAQVGLGMVPHLPPKWERVDREGPAFAEVLLAFETYFGTLDESHVMTTPWVWREHRRRYGNLYETGRSRLALIRESAQERATRYRVG